MSDAVKKLELVKKPIGLDLNALVKKAQEAYGKKEGGLAKQLTTGASLTRPEKDSDFIVWTKNDMWKSLTGLRGVPYGRGAVQLAGRMDSGKSSIANVFMVEAQNQGCLVILWDSERKFSKHRFEHKLGGDPNQLLVVNTSTILDGCKAVAHFVHAAKEQNPDQKILIVWDSVGASLSSTEDNDEDEDFSRQPGVSARENSYAIKKFNKLANKYMKQDTGEETIAILMVNQNYARMGMGQGFVEKGGDTVQYLSSVILQLSRKKDLVKTRAGEKVKYAILSRIKVKKNHLFEADDAISELDVIVSADGVSLAKDIPQSELKGWDDPSSDEE